MPGTRRCATCCAPLGTRPSRRSACAAPGTPPTWFDINLLDLAGRLIGEPSATGAIAVRPLPDASRYGVVEIENGRLTRFRDRPERSGSGLVSAGVDVFRRSMTDGLDRCCSLARAEKLLAAPFEGLLHRHRRARSICPRSARNSAPAASPGCLSRSRLCAQPRRRYVGSHARIRPGRRCRGGSQIAQRYHLD
jgi:hypothetical protein